MLYGNSGNGYSYSPDRSRDIDRFNLSTKKNYTTSYNTSGYGCFSPYLSNTNAKKGYYDGRGSYITD